MGIKNINIKNVRNIRKAKLNLNPNLNILVGENGSGKTSILEGLYLLGSGSSFRTNKLSHIIKIDCHELVVNGTVLDPNDLPIKLGISIQKQTRRIKVEGKDVQSRVRLLEHLPLQIVYPGSHLVVEGSPKNRREFIDWGVFYEDSQYINDWKSFKRALKQRNSLLKLKRYKDLEIWDFELAKYGTIVAKKRGRYLAKLEPYFRLIAKQFLSFSKIEFRYLPGWNSDKELLTVLSGDREKDLNFGFTQCGPHKGDVIIVMDGHLVRSFISRGQMKQMELALKLAQLKMLESNNGNHRSACFLLDDICAELDSTNLETLKVFIKNMDIQCLITTLDRSSMGNLCDSNSSMFKVEHGSVMAI